MNKKIKNQNKMIKSIYSLMIDLPAPINLSLWWNMGSILGLCLMIQIITGIILSMHYSATVDTAFNSISHIMRDVNYGWMLRSIHANGASMFFFMMYIHIGRGMYYGSFKMWKTWLTGVIILFMTMAAAFLGYVLPWGQMSFWGATVITNLMSAIPYIGDNLVKWIWGGFAVSNATISRFFSLHFILPLLISMVVMIHLMFLHETGSNNPMGINSNMDKIPFHPYFSIKDLMGFSTMLTILLTLNFSEPFMLSDPDNFSPANPMNTPIHIKPEWYFLFAYAILRSIPNKLGGVIALVMSISILMIKPISMKSKFKSMSMYPMSQMMFWMYLNTTILLTWIGAKPVEEPFSTLGLKLTLMYFSYFIIQPMTMLMWDKMIK